MSNGSGNPITSTRLLRAAMVATLLTIPAGASIAGHPLGTEDAGTLGRGNAQVEVNFERGQGSKGSRGTALGNSYTLGIAPRADLAVSFSYLFVKTDPVTGPVRGMGDTEVTLKGALHEGKGFVPTIGVKAGVALPTADHEKGLGTGRVNGLFTLIADWEFDKLLLHANAGSTVAGRPIGSRDRDDAFQASLAAEYSITERFTAVGEYLWGKNGGSSDASSSELTLGGKVALPADVTLDAGIRWGMSDAAPNVTWLAGITIALNGAGPITGSAKGK